MLDRKTGENEVLNGQYLIACDGAHSTIREKLNIEMHGEKHLGDYLSIYCTVDLKQYLNDKLGIAMIGA